jgi:hypothetical protein
MKLIVFLAFALAFAPGLQSRSVSIHPGIKPQPVPEIETPGLEVNPVPILPGIKQQQLPEIETPRPKH